LYTGFGLLSYNCKPK